VVLQALWALATVVEKLATAEAVVVLAVVLAAVLAARAAPRKGAAP